MPCTAARLERVQAHKDTFSRGVESIRNASYVKSTCFAPSRPTFSHHEDGSCENASTLGHTVDVENLRIPPASGSFCDDSHLSMMAVVAHSTPPCTCCRSPSVTTSDVRDRPIIALLSPNKVVSSGPENDHTIHQYTPVEVRHRRFRRCRKEDEYKLHERKAHSNRVNEETEPGTQIEPGWK